MTSYCTVSVHHTDYTRHHVHLRDGVPTIWLRSSDSHAPGLAFDLDAARTARDTLGRAISETEKLPDQPKAA